VHYVLEVQEPDPPVDPPGYVDDIFGDPPDDWNNCYGGFLGIYHNLTASHPDVEVAEGVDPMAVDELDWWDTSYQVFQRYDGSMEFGTNWWPVDDGLGNDPAYFSVRWVGWLRVVRSGTYDAVIGATTDSWLLLNGDPVVEVVNASEFETNVYPLTLDPGVYQVDVRYAHRRGVESGFRFRMVDSSDLLMCYPNYSEEE